MKRLFLATIMLGYSFFSNSLFSSGGVSTLDPLNPYCGFDEIVKECKIVTYGSMCITYEDCEELEVTPNNPTKPEEPEEPIEP